MRFTNLGKLAELGTPKLDIIGGKDCEGVTKTPGHGETFKLGDITVKGVHTPCHTQDSICFFMEDGNEKAVFTGDTLFIGGRFSHSLCVDETDLVRLRKILRGLCGRDA